MSTRNRARATVRRNHTILRAGLLVVIASMGAALSHQLFLPSSSTAMSPIAVAQGDRRDARVETDGRVPSGPTLMGAEHRGALRAAEAVIPLDTMAPSSEPDGPVGQADGVVPDGTTVFEEEVPGVANVDPALLSALRLAVHDAADDGVALFVESGWRSAEYQELLFRQAVMAYGSEEEAARWVATADTSAHVSGAAVDIGNSDAMAWLSEYGAAYGLCQIYTNEPWHYELRRDAIERGCPPMYADPTTDRRMQE